MVREAPDNPAETTVMDTAGIDVDLPGPALFAVLLQGVVATCAIFAGGVVSGVILGSFFR